MSDIRVDSFADELDDDDDIILDWIEENIGEFVELDEQPQKKSRP